MMSALYPRRQGEAWPWTPLVLLLALLAAAAAWLTSGHAGALPWQAHWYLPVHTTMEVFSVGMAMLISSTGWQSVCSTSAT
jgi:hypothetical protein